MQRIKIFLSKLVEYKTKSLNKIKLIKIYCQKNTASSIKHVAKKKKKEQNKTTKLNILVVENLQIVLTQPK